EPSGPAAKGYRGGPGGPSPAPAVTGSGPDTVGPPFPPGPKAGAEGPPLTTNGGAKGEGPVGAQVMIVIGLAVLGCGFLLPVLDRVARRAAAVKPNYAGASVPVGLGAAVALPVAAAAVLAAGLGAVPVVHALAFCF